MPDKKDEPDQPKTNDAEETGLTSRPADTRTVVLCIALGVFCIVFPFVGSRMDAGLFSKTLYLLSICMAFGLFLTAVGGYASGKWQGWTFGGAAATVVALFLLLLTVGKGGDETPREKTVLAKIRGPDIYSKVTAVEALQETGERLFVAPHREVNVANVLMEKDNLDADCIVFVMVPEADQDETGSSDEPIKLRVPTDYFKRVIAAAENTPRFRLNADLFYHHTAKALLNSDPEQNPDAQPVSLPGICVNTAAQTDPAPQERGLFGIFSSILDMSAFAADASDQDLIRMLVSSDALLRSAAREQIAKRGPGIIPALMESLNRSHGRNTYRAQLGVAASLAMMAEAGVKPEEIRSRLNTRDLGRLILLMGHEDETMRRWATAAIVRLKDERSVDMLVSKLNVTTTSEEGKYNAAYALREIAPKAKQPTRMKIVKATRALRAPITSKGTELLLKQVPVAADEAPAAGPGGWVYLGSKFGEKWAERHFDWPDGGSRMVAKDEVITASSDVNLREDHIKFSLKEGWKNSDIVGVVRSGDKVKVKSVKQVTPGFFWAEVTPAG